ncbi:VOC family protein [Paenibacillus lupini]|nr:VOC family protein [Paenibacillus lupini]NIK23241.1 catechol 2,3-dioxygenase-like lactoylglutathione lyase family enzyme [Paenibacillus lupini]
MTMKTRLLHVRANVSDLNRAIDWYENFLGFRVTNLAKGTSKTSQ